MSTTGGTEDPARGSIQPEPRRRPRDRKQQIVTAARDLFVAHGYPNVTMVAIAQQVGITGGALYRHFSGKSVLLERVVADSFDWLAVPLPAVGYGEVVEEIIARAAGRPYLSDLWTHEVRYLTPELQSDLHDRVRRWIRSLIDALNRDRPDLDHGQRELLSWAMPSLISGLGRQAMHSPAALRVSAVRDALHAVSATSLAPSTGLAERRRPVMAPASVRERLLAAAYHQFADSGYHETSMASLGAAAEVTGPNLYGYFASKADILRAVFDRSTHALWLGLGEVLASADTPAEALRRLVSSYISLSSSWAALLEDPTGEYGIEESARATQREYVAEWVHLLQQIFPGLDSHLARVRVQLALFLVSDLYGNRQVAGARSFRANLEALVLAVLLADPRPEAQ